MSQERDKIIVGDTTQKELMDLPFEQRVARLASVLDRGMTNVRLNVDVPSDVYGCWVPDDSTEIFRMRSMGFEMDTKYASKNSLHTDGTGKAKVGDVVYMTCPMVLKEALNEVARRKYIEVHGDPKDKKALHEQEKAFKASLEKQGGVPAMVGSKEEAVTASEIMATVAAK